MKIKNEDESYSEKTTISIHKSNFIEVVYNHFHIPMSFCIIDLSNFCEDIEKIIDSRCNETIVLFIHGDDDIHKPLYLKKPNYLNIFYRKKLNQNDDLFEINDCYNNDPLSNSLKKFRQNCCIMVNKLFQKIYTKKIFYNPQDNYSLNDSIDIIDKDLSIRFYKFIEEKLQEKEYYRISKENYEFVYGNDGIDPCFQKEHLNESNYKKMSSTDWLKCDESCPKCNLQINLHKISCFHITKCKNIYENFEILQFMYQKKCKNKNNPLRNYENLTRNHQIKEENTEFSELHSKFKKISSKNKILNNKQKRYKSQIKKLDESNSKLISSCNQKKNKIYTMKKKLRLCLDEKNQKQIENDYLKEENLKCYSLLEKKKKKIKELNEKLIKLKEENRNLNSIQNVPVEHVSVCKTNNFTEESMIKDKISEKSEKIDSIITSDKIEKNSGHKELKTLNKNNKLESSLEKNVFLDEFQIIPPENKTGLKISKDFYLLISQEIENKRKLPEKYKNDSRLKQLIFIGESGSGKSSLILQIINILMKSKLETQFGFPKFLEIDKIYSKIHNFGISYYYIDEQANDFYEFIEAPGILVLRESLQDEENIKNVINGINYMTMPDSNIIFVQKSDSYHSCSSIVALYNHFLLLKSNEKHIKFRTFCVYTFFAGDLIFLTENLCFNPIVSIKINNKNLLDAKQKKLDKLKSNWIKSRNKIEKLLNSINNELSEVAYQNQFILKNTKITEQDEISPKNIYEKPASFENYFEVITKYVYESKLKIMNYTNRKDLFKNIPSGSYFFYKQEEEKYYLKQKFIIDEDNCQESYKIVLNTLKESQTLYILDEELSISVSKSHDFKHNIKFLSNKLIQFMIGQVYKRDSESIYLINKNNLSICQEILPDSRNTLSWSFKKKHHKFKCKTCKKYKAAHVMTKGIYIDGMGNEILDKSKCKTLENNANKNEVKIDEIDLTEEIKLKSLYEIQSHPYLTIFNNEFKFIGMVPEIDPLRYNSKNELLSKIKDSYNLDIIHDEKYYIIDCFYKSESGSVKFHKYP